MNRNRDFKNIDGLERRIALTIKSRLRFLQNSAGRNKSAGAYEGEDIAQQAWFSGPVGEVGKM